MNRWTVMLVALGLAFATACEENLPRPTPPTGKAAENGATPKSSFSSSNPGMFTFPDAAALDAPEEAGL